MRFTATWWELLPREVADAISEGEILERADWDRLVVRRVEDDAPPGTLTT